MKLTNKVKAAGATAGVVVFAVLVSSAIQLVLENVDPETLAMIGGGIICFGFLYLIYQLMLARFDYEDSVKKMVDEK